MTSCLINNIQELKKIDSLYNLFGVFFWGYGINNICDGYEENVNPDVFEIKKIGGLNQHHESYRNLLLLTFKIEKSFLFVSTFSIDSCGVPINSNINRQYDLRDFEYARIKKRTNSILVEFIFRSSSKPIHFQIDTYYFGGYNLSGDQLAKYYFDKITELANESLRVKAKSSEPPLFDFIKDFISGIKHLQIQDEKESCIRNIKTEKKNHESPFRNWFQMWFTAKNYIAEAEPERRSGRIDLKVTQSSIGDKIIEFKGWWNNNDKKVIIQQVCSYLTEFEKDGYIFMINHKETDIVEEYKKIIMSPEMRFVPDSWEKIYVEPTGYSYFTSRHSFSNEGKILFHFIFPIYQ
jgi:hypothetical protein